MTNYRQTGSAGYLFSIVLVAVIGGLLFGYDTAVISGAEKGLQAFFMNAKDFTYSNFLHGFTTSSALIGCIIGSALSGVLASRMGRKKALFLAGVFFFLSAMGSYYPEFLFFPKGEPTFSLLIAFNLYRVLGGLGVGMASAICPMYIAEIAPANKRGTLVSWNQFAIIFGQLVVYFVNFLILGSHANPVIDLVDGVNQILNPEASAWTAATGWRLMFVSECVPAGLFALLILLVPETPRYLALSGQDEKALTVLSNINGESKAREILAEIKATATEKTEKLFTYGWVVIFIGIMLSVFQQAIGINAVLYFAPRIFESMGMGNPMMYTVFMGVINISFTLLAVFTVEKLGRKPLLIWGSTLMAVGALGVAFSNVIAGCPSIVPVVSILVYSAAFMFSWGPICWVLISEIFPNTIRSQATAIAVAFQWIFNFIVSSTFVPLYNMRVGSMGVAFGHFTAYAIYGVISIIAAIFVWKMVPETKGKTLEDMSKLWKK
ncbi:MAG: D-xylose transporter XylE [Bacteroidales bacterium]|nr:D-xylose transporter XylE [Bacteroidales bacterium]MEE3406963.1 D-xylose transporter XylE [Candidatus Cryptobacteroides sp.]SKC59986.1 MFS transporter, SP family, xylose:H+ symportor [Bacteroidales bacterium WCE2008]MBQ2526066.1 D-xylose transporter XylE [Bacteroidales bacterium]MBQ3917962.1 D-xylose transporter XylE [Bacteroidales bacterium]